MESGAEAEGGVTGSDIGRVNGEDGGGISENGSLELAPEVVIGGERESCVEGVILADETYGVVSMLNDFGSGSGSGWDEAESKSGVSGGGTRAIDLGGALEQFN